MQHFILIIVIPQKERSDFVVWLFGGMLSFFVCLFVFGFFVLSPFFLFFSSHVSFFKRVVRIAPEDPHQVAEPLLQSPGCWCCSKQFCLSTFLVY